MTRIALLGLAACATRDVLHSELLVARAACSGEDVAVFGHPGDQRTCTSDVVTLGDGCYVASGQRPARVRQMLADGRAWAPHLFECAAAAPDGHVVCVDDTTAPGRSSFGDPEVTEYTVALDHVADVGRITTGRCRGRLYAWELAHLPPLHPLDVIATSWQSYPGPVGDLGTRETWPDVRASLREDAIAFGRQLSPWVPVLATVCSSPAGLDVAFRSPLGARLSQELAAIVRRALADATFTTCTRVSFSLELVDR